MSTNTKIMYMGSVSKREGDLAKFSIDTECEGKRFSLITHQIGCHLVNMIKLLRKRTPNALYILKITCNLSFCFRILPSSCFPIVDDLASELLVCRFCTRSCSNSCLSTDTFLT